MCVSITITFFYTLSFLGKSSNAVFFNYYVNGIFTVPSTHQFKWGSLTLLQLHFHVVIFIVGIRVWYFRYSFSCCLPSCLLVSFQAVGILASSLFNGSLVILLTNYKCLCILNMTGGTSKWFFFSLHATFECRVFTHSSVFELNLYLQHSLGTNMCFIYMIM